MDFELSETQLLIRETARKFAMEELAPSASERDEKEEFPHEAIKKLGELGFMGMMVPEEFGGAGFDTISYVLAMEEISKVDASVGVIASIAYAKQRKAFGKYISEFQGIQFKIADMAMKIDAARLMVYKAAYLKDTGQPYGQMSAMAKLFTSKTAVDAALEAIQIHGGYGYTKE
jgi:alkylation response protein AidB-like acyl-CoA dehydrogenase